MQRISIVVALGMALACVTAQAAERRLDKTFTVAPGGRLTVEADGSDIQVTGSDSNQVVVHVLMKGSEKTLDAMTLSAEQGVDGVAVVAKRHGSGWFSLWGNNEASITVVVPHRYNTNLRTSGGNIEVSQIEGEAEGETSGGDVRITKVGGPVEMKTSGGNMNVTEVAGNTRIHTSGGDITVRSLKGELKAQTSGGDVRLEDIGGATTAATSGGDVVASNIRGPTDLRSSGGSVKAEGIDGSIRASSSGGDVRVELIGANRGITTATTGGDIVMRVSRNISGELDAATSGGSVTSDLPVTTTEAREKRLAGPINGGGAEIRARTSGGSIRLQARD